MRGSAKHDREALMALEVEPEETAMAPGMPSGIDEGDDAPPEPSKGARRAPVVVIALQDDPGDDGFMKRLKGRG